MIKKILRTALVAIGIMIIFLLIAKIGSLFDERKYNRIKNNKCTTTGEIIDVNRRRTGTYITIHAFINGNEIEFRGSEPSNKVLAGECFEIEYNCNNPEERYVVYEHPTFVKGDEGKIGIVTGKITKTDSDYIEYEYLVNDTLFSKQQAISENKVIDFSKSYKVGYLKYYPYISILYFE